MVCFSNEWVSLRRRRRSQLDQRHTIRVSSPSRLTSVGSEPIRRVLLQFTGKSFSNCLRSHSLIEPVPTNGGLLNCRTDNKRVAIKPPVPYRRNRSPIIDPRISAKIFSAIDLALCSRPSKLTGFNPARSRSGFGLLNPYPARQSWSGQNSSSSQVSSISSSPLDKST